MAKSKHPAGRARNALLAIGSIVRDPRLQMRVLGLDPSHVADIMRAIDAGRPIDRVRVYHVGNVFFLTEGFHRMEAYECMKVEKIPAVVTDGTWTDAVVDASQANKNTFSLKRSQADKRNQCVRLIEEVEGSGQTGWSVAKYAKTVDVSRDLAKELLDAYVEKMMAAKGEGVIEDAGVFKGKDAAGLPTLFTEPHVPEFRVGADGKRRAVKPGRPRMPEPDFGGDEQVTEEEAKILEEAIEYSLNSPPIVDDPNFKSPLIPPAKPAAVGKPKVDWAKIEAACGLLARSLDDVEAIDVFWRNSLEQKNCQTLLNRYLEAWRTFANKIKARQFSAEFEAAKNAF